MILAKVNGKKRVEGSFMRAHNNCHTQPLGKEHIWSPLLLIPTHTLPSFWHLPYTHLFAVYETAGAIGTRAVRDEKNAFGSFGVHSGALLLSSRLVTSSWCVKENGVSHYPSGIELLPIVMRPVNHFSREAALFDPSGPLEHTPSVNPPSHLLSTSI